MTPYTLTITFDGIHADSPQEAAEEAVRMVTELAWAGGRIFVDAENEDTGEVTPDIEVVLGRHG